MALVGRITLAKSVTDEIPLYPMTNKLPNSCINAIYGLQRKFVWGDTYEKRKLNVVVSVTVTMLKQLGGVRLRDLNVKNQACSMKLGWNLYNNSNDLWCTVLRIKYKVLECDDCAKIRTTNSSL